MTTSMHRLQISLPEQQMRYLSERSRREDLSIAEIIRRLVADAAEREAPRPADAGLPLGEARAVYQTAARPVSAEVILDLSPELYQRLRWRAGQAGKSASAIAQEWLTERLTAELAPVLNERERVTQVLREAGLLVELDGELKKRADPTINLEEVCAALDRTGGKPLSEIILEQRGPRG